MSLFLANVAGWIWAHKAITFLLLIIAFGGIYYFCSTNALRDEINREKQARSDQSQKAIEDAKTESNQAANLSNQAMENLEKVKQSNLNSYSNNWNAAQERYCKEIGGC